MENRTDYDDTNSVSEKLVKGLENFANFLESQVQYRDVSLEQFLKALKRQDRTHTVVYDIETRPGEKELIERFYQEDPKKVPPDPGEWDESMFRPGSAKKPETLEAKRQQQRQEHKLKRAAWRREVDQLREEAWLEYQRSCQLNPWRCEVAAIGYGYVVPPPSEADLKVMTPEQIAKRPQFVTCLDLDSMNPFAMLSRFQQVYDFVKASGGKLFAHNGDKFDLPVLQTRSWVHNQPVTYFNEYGKSEQFHVDTSKVAVSYRYGEYISLADLCTYLKVPHPKSEEISGAEWWEAFNDDRRELAIEYLRLDVISLYECIQKMRLI